MTKLYLHIGSSKTGTTSLQSFFEFNYELLLKQGILYPRTGNKLNENAHHLFARRYRPSADVGDRFTTLQRLKQEVQEKEPDSIIMSSEGFYAWPPERVEILREDLKGFDVEIIVFLRCQDEHIDLLFTQRVKARKTNLTPTEFADLCIQSEFHDNAKVLDLWARTFGEERVHVTPFEKNLQPKGFIIDTVRNIIGIQDDGNLFVPDLKNTRVPNRHALRYMQKLPATSHPAVKALVRTASFTNYSRKYPDPEECRYHLSPAKRAEIASTFEESDAEVARRFLERGGRLSCDKEPRAMNRGLLMKGCRPKKHFVLRFI